MPTMPDAVTPFPPATRRRPWRWLLGTLGLAGVVLAATQLPLDRWILDLVEWVRGAGGLGMAVFALAYVLATVLMLPGSSQRERATLAFRCA